MTNHEDHRAVVSGRMLTGKLALVTGSTSGIGLAVARALAAAGANIVLNGFGKSDEITMIRRELEAENGVSVLYSGADMSDAGAIEGMMRMVRAAHGDVDILVNNAGIQHVAPVAEFPVDKWNSIIAINLTAAFHTSRLAIPAMIERGYGRIINIASAHGLVASPFKSAYVAAKHGTIGLTRTIALELAEQAITCNAICPGYVETPLVAAQIDDQARANKISRESVVRDVLLARQPNKRFVGATEIGALTVFLAGPDAASITGTALPVDGGWTAQ
ncbi:MAG TPA: 3-hydroxybutyrate dehydrogenase [Stellaceae bacterium]|nr:3-hydroxybutyrate dehydrogenase [Stellaceae bacterium]